MYRCCYHQFSLSAHLVFVGKKLTFHQETVTPGGCYVLLLDSYISSAHCYIHQQIVTFHQKAVTSHQEIFHPFCRHMSLFARKPSGSIINKRLHQHVSRQQLLFIHRQVYLVQNRMALFTSMPTSCCEVDGGIEPFPAHDGEARKLRQQ